MDRLAYTAGIKVTTKLEFNYSTLLIYTQEN